MERKIYFIFTDYKEHPDLSFLDYRKISLNYISKGDIRSNGKTIQAYNSAEILLNQDLPDDYNGRIEALISAAGGATTVKRIALSYQAKTSAIVLGIPARTGDTIEDSYISHETMKKLYSLGLDLHFYYT